jgi:hypothetical protein
VYSQRAPLIPWLQIIQEEIRINGMERMEAETARMQRKETPVNGYDTANSGITPLFAFT